MPLKSILAALGARLSYANMVATLALFAALCGGTYAATTTSAPSAHAAKKKKARRGPRGRRGKRGPRGFTGAKGATGATGAHGATGSRGLTGSPAASAFTGGFQENNASDVYAAAEGLSTISITDDTTLTTLSPARTMTGRDLFVRESDADPPDHARTFTLMVNHVNSALTCTIPTGPTGTCSDTTHPVPIPAGSPLSLHLQNGGTSGGSPLPRVAFGWRATTP